MGSRFGSGDTTTFIPLGSGGVPAHPSRWKCQRGSGTFGHTDSTTDFFVDADANVHLGRLYEGVYRVMKGLAQGSCVCPEKER